MDQLQAFVTQLELLSAQFNANGKHLIALLAKSDNPLAIQLSHLIALDKTQYYWGLFTSFLFKNLHLIFLLFFINFISPMLVKAFRPTPPPMPAAATAVAPRAEKKKNK